jgi:hypothetical protein
VLTIGRLKLTLPPNLATRADQLARLVAGELAALPDRGTIVIDRLTLPPVRVSEATTDRQVAMDIALAIHDGIRGKAD